MPKISIIVPMYNVERWLARCIESLRGQTIQDIEILLINDGSPDSCGRIADEYTVIDDRIRVIHARHGGVSVARNRGIRAARGDYIGFVDADDFVDRDFYEKLYDRAITTDVDIVKGQALKHELDGKLYIGPLHDQIRDQKAHFFYNFWSAIYRRDFLRKNRIWFPRGLVLGEDDVFLARAIHNTDRLELVDDTAYHYIRRRDSAYGTSMTDTKIQSCIKMVDLIISALNRSKTDPKNYTASFIYFWWYLHENIFLKTDNAKLHRTILKHGLRNLGRCKYGNDIIDLTRVREYHGYWPVAPGSEMTPDLSVIYER